MSKRVRRTKQVREDIIHIYRFIRERSPQSADKVFDAIEQTIRSLVDMPGIGHQWDTPDPRLAGMRVVVVKKYRNYLVFFRPTGDGIEVYRVVHGARELERLWDDLDLTTE